MNNIKKINVHSNKFIRLARNAKLANITFKQFTYFGKKQNINKNDNILLFLNQGLKSDDLIKLRCNLKIIGINLTHISTKIWSNSLIQQKKSLLTHNKKLKKTIYGNILSLWHNKINSNIHPIHFLYQIIQKNILNSNGATNIYLNQDILHLYKWNNISNLTYNDIENQSNLYKLILPWELLSSQLIKDKLNQNYNSFLLNTWFDETNNINNHVNNLLNLLKNQHLTYIGLLNTIYNNDSYLFYDNNIKLNYDNINGVYEHTSQICFESFKFSILTRNYLIYL